jgi:hypothetical protein
MTYGGRAESTSAAKTPLSSYRHIPEDGGFRKRRVHALSRPVNVGSGALLVALGSAPGDLPAVPLRLARLATPPTAAPWLPPAELRIIAQHPACLDHSTGQIV